MKLPLLLCLLAVKGVASAPDVPPRVVLRRALVDDAGAAGRSASHGVAGPAASSAAALTQADLERMLASSPSFARLLKRKAPPGGPSASGEEEETAAKTPKTQPKLKASLPLGKWVDGGSNYLLDGVRYSRAEAVTQLEDLSLEPGDYCLEVLYSAGRVSDRVDHSQCPDGHESSSARHRIPKGFKPSLCRTDREERTARGSGGKDKRGSPTGKKGKGKGK